jgi:hypothetical protein
MFKTQETANKAIEFTQNEWVNITDDFGQQASFRGEQIYGFLLEDLNASKLAHIERALHNARMQAEGQKMAQADPALVHASRGPNIISPMGMGNGRFPAG